MKISTTIPLAALGATGALITSCALGEPEEPPAFSEIRDDIFPAMQDSDSVTMVGIEGNPEDLSDEMRLLGDLTADAVVLEVGTERNPYLLSYGDETYMSVSGFLTLMAPQIESDLAALEDPDLAAEVEAMLDEIGGWYADVSEDPGTEDLIPERMSDLLDQWQEHWESDTDRGRDALDEEGSLDEIDGVDVWVYTGEFDGDELTMAVEADADAPRVILWHDGYQERTFTDWDSTEVSEPPAESDIHSEDEVNERIAEIEDALSN